MKREKFIWVKKPQSLIHYIPIFTPMMPTSVTDTDLSVPIKRRVAKYEHTENCRQSSKYGFEFEYVGLREI